MPTLSSTPNKRCIMIQTCMNEKEFEFLTNLLQARGPSGYEEKPQQVFLDYCGQFADDTGSDSYGNSWAAVGPKDAPVILVAGHGDEIGLIVNRVEENGFVRFFAIGGVDPAILIARRVWVQANNGELVAGVVGALPIHLQDKDSADKTPKIWDLFLDVGATSADEAKAMGVSVGCHATLQETWMLMPGNRIVSRALDNRIGVFAAARAIQILAPIADTLPFRVVAVSTVQEEIGAIGAEMVTRRFCPTACIVVDVTHATDVPGCNQNRYGAVSLGRGPTITHGAANHRGLLQHLLQTADQQKINLQHEAANRYTGTDTDHMYRRLEGVPSVLVSLPNRYMHTTAEMSSLDDLVQIPQLVAAAIKTMPTEI